MESLREIDPVPERTDEDRWRPRVRVVTEDPAGARTEYTLEAGDPDLAFEEEEKAREHATRMALRWLADRLGERGEGDAP